MLEAKIGIGGDRRKSIKRIDGIYRQRRTLSVLGALPRLVALGFPTLLGTSRKSTIGKLTARDVDGRAFGTAATVALAAAAGIDIVRVHDVGEMAQVARVADCLLDPVRCRSFR